MRLCPTGHPTLPGGLFCAIGNPLNDGTWAYTWSNGRQLTRMNSIDKDVRFVYNENGLRVQKTVNGVATNYTRVVTRHPTIDHRNRAATGHPGSALPLCQPANTGWPFLYP